MKKSLAPLALFVASALVCLAEGDSKKEDASYLEKFKKLYDEQLKDAKKLYEDQLDAGKKAGAKSKEWILKDFEGIGDWEYKVVNLEGGDVAALEKLLNGFGSERWQCFWVEASDRGRIFFFKRPKRTYLNKIPAGELLRLIGNSEKE